MTAHKASRPQAKAEVLYRYISGNDSFIEKHTGLEDVMIEKEIFTKCIIQHKKILSEIVIDIFVSLLVLWILGSV